MSVNSRSTPSYPLSPSSQIQMPPLKDKVLAHCFYSTLSTSDNKTVRKGRQIWLQVEEKLIFMYDAECEERLARENTIYEHLGKHPQILTSFGLEEVHPGVHLLRLEMFDPPELPPNMALDVATGLSHMHLRGAMSCTLSGRHIFVFDDLRVKLGDFGASILNGFDFKNDLTYESRYDLPQRGREWGDVPLIKSELFSLGSAIYEITAWKIPFAELADHEVDHKYAKEEFPSLDDNAARHIIWKCWTEAYATAQEVVNDLKSCELS